MKIVKITKTEEYVDTYDIEVNNVHHYILDNGCVSHNSSVLSNATNGIEPPRSLVSVKESRSGILKQVIPDVKKMKNKIQLLWDMGTNEYNIRLIGIMQKWVCQSISANISYNPEYFDEHKIPLSYIARDILLAYKYGLKSLYYSNVYDRSEAASESLIADEGCAGGACKI